MKNTLSMSVKLIFVFLSLLLASCGGGVEHSSSSGETVGMTMRLVWEDGGGSVSRAVTTPRSAPSGVVTVRCRVTGSGMNEIVSDFAASAGSGVIPEVPVGADRVLAVQGMDSAQNVIYQGGQSGINLVSGQPYDCGVITMTSVGGSTSTTTTQTQITTTTQAPITTTTSSTTTTTLFHDNTFIQNGLVAYYPFDGNANDESGNGNNGTVRGAMLTADRFGNPNSAYSFDGTSGYIEIQDSTSLALTPDFSISLWFNNYSDTDRGRLLTKGTDYDRNFHVFWETAAGESCAPNTIWANISTAGVCSNVLSLNTWYHVTFVVKGGSFLNIYIDGLLHGSLNTASVPDITSQPLLIGAYPGPRQFFEGTIDDIRIYNRALNSYEILTLSSQGEASFPETVSSVGQVWMDRNLGASDIATSFDDSAAYGDLYQWGRGADGHQLRTSSTTSTTSLYDDPGHGNFITIDRHPYDWLVVQNDLLWQGLSGINNPCPAGFRLPTETELDTERTSWVINDSRGAFASPLRLPSAGYRSVFDGALKFSPSPGHYWSSTVSGTHAMTLDFDNGSSVMFETNRAYGISVRCIKD
ncbi:MAG: hypothetical protein KJ950_16720 [Proteobacteria bacterium]|nr:hypothetical protein [Pseudomonadota bacterium]MBU1688126.1 hypothetical protein [Pseudomonadota bacterium]